MSKILAIDFDGTIVEDRFPGIGELKDGAVSVLNRLRHEGYYLILWTCRAEKRLADAVLFLAEAGIKFDKINEGSPDNLDLYSGLDTRKIYADMYIDDKSMVKPLPHWEEIYQLVHERLPTHVDRVILECYL